MKGGGKGICVGVLGIDHRHIFGQLGGMLEQGAVCKGWWTAEPTGWEEGFCERFPDVPQVHSRMQLLEDPEIQMMIIASIPDNRAADAIEAMEHGKDVMLDKPGCTTLKQLEQIKKVVAHTSRIWSIDFSERFEVPAVSKASELVFAGAIGKVVQTMGLGPHRINRKTRKEWFFQRARYGGILADIASHQIDQFLHFTGSTDSRISHSSVGNFANPQDPGLDDFGEVVLASDHARGYIRVDWFTPDALPTWGDGRLVILGTEGYIELRKYVDVAGRPGADHLFLVNNHQCEHIDCADAPLTYFSDLTKDVRERTEDSMAQAHAFKVTELALRAQMMAEDSAGIIRNG